MYKKILLPIDGSENSKRASQHAIDLADINNSEIIVLFVLEPYYPGTPILPISTLPSPDENYYAELRKEGKKIINDFKEELEKNQCKGKCKNVHITTLIKEGKAHIEILKTMDEENVDLVVMGASGRHSTLDRTLLGSITEKVIREAKHPVIVIP
jgi:nucleotide-binding universal stress UspA family protein